MLPNGKRKLKSLAVPTLFHNRIIQENTCADKISESASSNGTLEKSVNLVEDTKEKCRG